MDGLPVLIPHLQTRLLLLRGKKKARLHALSECASSSFLWFFEACFLKKKKSVCVCVFMGACLHFGKTIFTGMLGSLNLMLSISQQQTFPSLLSQPPKRA